jgi:ABC-type ATPase with predicted acetyltransferase domain
VSKHLEGDDKDKELARIEATNRELSRKLLDIQERYAMTVEAWLHSAMIIHLPTVHIQCELQRKKAKRTVTAVWNPFTKIIEPLRCSLSGEPVYDFYLDDREAKIISPTVWKK